MNNLVGKYFIDVKVPTFRETDCIYKIIPKSIILIDVSPIYIVANYEDDYELYKVYIIKSKIGEYLSLEEDTKTIEECKYIFTKVINSYDMIKIGVTKLPYWQLLHQFYSELDDEDKIQVSPIPLQDREIRVHMQKVVYLTSINNPNSCLVFQITESEDDLRINESNYNLINIEGKDTMPEGKNFLIGAIDILALTTYDIICELGYKNIREYRIRNSPYSITNLDKYPIQFSNASRILKTIREKLLDIFTIINLYKESIILDYIIERTPTDIFTYTLCKTSDTDEREFVFLSKEINNIF